MGEGVRQHEGAQDGNCSLTVVAAKASTPVPACPSFLYPCTGYMDFNVYYVQVSLKSPGKGNEVHGPLVEEPRG